MDCSAIEAARHFDRCAAALGYLATHIDLPVTLQVGSLNPNKSDCYESVRSKVQSALNFFISCLGSCDLRLPPPDSVTSRRPLESATLADYPRDEKDRADSDRIVRDHL